MSVTAIRPQSEPAPDDQPVGDLVAHALAELGVTTVFGVISIHNMPILDAIARQGRVRFVPARADIAAALLPDLRGGDMVVTLGAGDIHKVGDDLLHALAREHPAALQ